MSYPVAFEQPPKSEADENVQQNLVNNLHLDIEGQKDEHVQATIQQPEGKIIPKEEKNRPLENAEMEKKHLAKKEPKNPCQKGGSDAFPLAKENADTEQIQCHACGHTKCKWCEESIDNVKGDDG